MNDSYNTTQALIDRHVRFWTHDEIDRPLIARMPPYEWVGKPYPTRSGKMMVNPTAIMPEDIDVDRLLGLDRPLPSLVEGDILYALGCLYPQAWMGSIIGCPILASAYGVVAKPVGMDVPEAGINAVVNAPDPVVIEAVGDQAVRQRTSKRFQNFAGLGESLRLEQQSRQRNERISSPISEPGVTG